MSACIFCAIVAGDAPAHRVYEDQTTLAFLDIMPFTRGHTLVIPKAHSDDVWDVDEDTAAAVMRSGHRVAALLRETLAPDGMNLLQATRAVAFQTVFHLHLHVIPRWEGDTMAVPPWPKPRRDRDELEALRERILAGA